MIRRWRRRDDGSVLVLVPAGFVVVLVLGAVAVDSAAAYLGQRQLSDAAAAAANDAASAALSDRSFYGGGALVIDPARAATVVCQAVAAQADGDLHDVHLSVAIAGALIEVHASATVPAVFGRALPGGGGHRVQADAVASAQVGPAGTPVAVAAPAAPLVPLIC